MVKNTLALRAIDSTALAALEEHFVGPTAVVFTDHDPVALAKALTDYAKEVPALEFKAGLVERRAETRISHVGSTRLGACRRRFPDTLFQRPERPG